MKYSLCLTLILFYISPHLKGQDTVLLFHPTATNIETFLILSDGVMLNGSERNKIHYLGIYHTGESYDYTKSKELLRVNPVAGDLFTLKPVGPLLTTENIFSNNEFSESMESLFQNSIGAIFPGGPDLPPATYGFPMNLLTKVTDPNRHYLELTALFHLLGSRNSNNYTPLLEQNPDYLILGICLGMQTMNIATGGTLIQDIPNEVYRFHYREQLTNHPGVTHRNYYFDDPSDSIKLSSYHFHQIRSGNQNWLSDHLGLNNEPYPYVLSSHHQGVSSIGSGLVPALWSMDGKIIEALIHEEYQSVLAVQFHPEKADLFTGSEVRYVTPDSSINYKEFIENNDSEIFHKRFWEMIGNILHEN